MFNANYIERSLVGILENPDSPPRSLEEIARNLGSDRRTIYRHFPDLCRQISRIYIDYKVEGHRRAVQESCSEVEQVVKGLLERNIHPTEELVSGLISRPGFLRYKEVRSIFKQTLSTGI